MEFIPPVKERDTEELVEIANCKNDDWQEELKNQASVELENRGVTREMQDEILARWAKDWAKLQAEIDKERAQNALESYSFIKMFLIFLLSPYILLGKLPIGYSYSDLKEFNYTIMARQRLYLLLFGSIFYIVFLYILTHI
jgi:hypothetical protein